MKPSCIKILLFSIFSAVSQAADLPVARPTVTKAFDVFEQYPDKISQGTTVTFKKKDTVLASRLVANGVQARIFSLNDQEKSPYPITTIDDCNAYTSVVIQLKESNKTDFILQKLEESWLNLSNSGNSIKDGRYFIVFEKAGPAEQNFRLLAKDARAYFDNGFVLIVTDNGSANLEKVRSEYEKRQSRLDSLHLEIDDTNIKVPCYRYTKYAEETESIENPEITLARCEAIDQSS